MRYLRGWLQMYFFFNLPCPTCPSRHGLTCPDGSPFPFAVEQQRRDCGSKQHRGERDSERDGVGHAHEDADRFFLSDHIYILFLCSPRLLQAYCARWRFRDSSASVLGFLQGPHGSISHNCDLRKRRFFVW